MLLMFGTVSSHSMFGAVLRANKNSSWQYTSRVLPTNGANIESVVPVTLCTCDVLICRESVLLVLSWGTKA